jgi:hypothetical protein
MVAFTYDQWERLPIGMKEEMYVAGAIDALSTISVPPVAATAALCLESYTLPKTK